MPASSGRWKVKRCRSRDEFLRLDPHSGVTDSCNEPHKRAWRRTRRTRWKQLCSKAEHTSRYPSQCHTTIQTLRRTRPNLRKVIGLKLPAACWALHSHARARLARKGVPIVLPGCYRHRQIASCSSAPQPCALPHRPHPGFVPLPPPHCFSRCPESLTDACEMAQTVLHVYNSEKKV